MVVSFKKIKEDVVLIETKKIKDKILNLKDKIVKQSKNFLTDLPNKFYKLGKFSNDHAIEFSSIFSKITKNVFTKTFKSIGKCAYSIGGLLNRGLRFVLKVITYPFVKTYAAVKVIGMGLYHSRDMHVGKKVTTVSHFVGAGFKNNKKFFTTAMNYALPVVGVFVFVATINFTNTQTYAVNVTYNDQVLGYVENENTVEKAKKIVQNMMVFTDDTEEIAIKPEYEITVIEGEKMLSEYQLAEAIIGESGSEMIEAEGLYVDGTFHGATTDLGHINETLDFVLDSNSTGQEGEQISFSRNVEVVEGLYLTENIVTAEDMTNLLTGQTKQQQVYTTARNETLTDVVQNANVDTQTVKSLNPDLATVSEDKKLAEGTEILLSQSESFLPVQVTKTITYSEAIPYETVEQTSDDYVKGYSFTSQNGVEGENQITASVTYLDNVEIEREIVSSQILTQPQQKIITVGTSEPPQIDASIGSGVSAEGFIWPTSGQFSSPFGSRWGGWHSGIDIASSAGTPIYAAAGGTVTFASYSGGYGNIVKIDHGDGVSTFYAHCSSMSVSVGQVVAQGDYIAAMGTTGNSTGNHLHFEVRINGTAYDPVAYLP